MTTAAITNGERPADTTRRLVRAGLTAALVFALSADVMQFEASKECRGGFSSGFGAGFDVHRCAMVIRKTGSDAEMRIPLPR
jgi:hypothetical protein